MHEIQACGPLRSDYKNGETRLAWEDYVNNANTETERESVVAYLLAGGLHSDGSAESSALPKNMWKYMEQVELLAVEEWRREKSL